MKFINRKLFISGLIVVFMGFFINIFPMMVVNNLHSRYRALNLIPDSELRNKIQNELTYHLIFWEKFSATMEPLGILIIVVGVLLIILAFTWKFLE